MAPTARLATPCLTLLRCLLCPALVTLPPAAHAGLKEDEECLFFHAQAYQTPSGDWALPLRGWSRARWPT